MLNGARQVGKSTLAELVLRESGRGVARFLDDPVTRAAASADPVRFVRHDGLLLIDEVQRVPELWLAIKHLVDRDPRPGRFLLTGSARLLGLRSLPDALTVGWPPTYRPARWAAPTAACWRILCWANWPGN